jgi:hypothetical protein
MELGLSKSEYARRALEQFRARQMQERMAELHRFRRILKRMSAS